MKFIFSSPQVLLPTLELICDRSVQSTLTLTTAQHKTTWKYSKRSVICLVFI